MSMPEDLNDALRRTVAAVHAPGVTLPPWKVETRDGGPESLRKNNIGIMGGCEIEHAHDSDAEADACVLCEFAIVCLNDSRLPATHEDNVRQLATARAIVAAYNFMARYGAELLAAAKEKP